MWKRRPPWRRGVRAGIKALAGEVAAELADQLHGGLGDDGGGTVGASGAGLEGGLALAPEASDEAADPALGDSVSAGNLMLRAALDEDGGDDETGLRHPPTLPPRPARGCAARGRSGDSYVLRDPIPMS